MKKVIIFLVFLLLVVSLSNLTCALGEGNQNLLVNGSFEVADPEQKPENWRADFWHPDSTLTLTTKKAHQGKYALEITSDKATNDARMLQTVQVKPNTYYQLSGWVATENVTPQKIGANLCVMTNTFTSSSSLNDTIDWTHLEYNFLTTSKQTEVTVGPRLGMWGNDVKGVAYFDDLSLVELNSPPASFQTLQEPPAQTNTTANAKTTAKFSFPIIGRIIGIILIVLVIVFFVYKKIQKKDKDTKDEHDTENDIDMNEIEDVEEITEEGNEDGNKDKES